MSKPGPLDHNQTFNAPKRRLKKMDSIVRLLESKGDKVSVWEHGGYKRIYFLDQSYIWADQTGLIRSSGGLATRAKFSNQLQ